MYTFLASLIGITSVSLVRDAGNTLTVLTTAEDDKGKDSLTAGTLSLHSFTEKASLPSEASVPVLVYGGCYSSEFCF